MNHTFLPPSILFFNRNKTIVMIIIVGIRKLSAPNTIKQIIETKIPILAGIWLSALSHCSTKITTNKAVIEKSTPVVSKELANPTFVPIDPFKNIQSEKNALNHELEPLNIDEYQAPKKETQTTSIDYDKLELEICELRKQIAELTKKIG